METSYSWWGSLIDDLWSQNLQGIRWSITCAPQLLWQKSSFLNSFSFSQYWGKKILVFSKGFLFHFSIHLRWDLPFDFTCLFVWVCFLFVLGGCLFFWWWWWTLSQVTSFIGSFFKRLLHTCAGLSLCVSHRCVRIAFCLPRLHHHTSLSWCLLCQHYYWRARRRIRTLLFLLMGSYYTYTWALPYGPLRLSLCVPGFLA